MVLDSERVNERGFFRVDKNNFLNGERVTRFRFVHLEGEVSCRNETGWFNNWGCASV